MSSKGESDMDLIILVGGLHWQLGSLWRGALLGFRLVRAFFGSIGRSEVAIGLTRRLGRVEVGEFAPLWCYMVFLFIFFLFRTHLAPVRPVWMMK